MENEKKSEWGGYEMPEGMYEDLFGEVLKARDYEPTKEEISMENDKQTNTGNGKNYTFQNSTVNIYEEGNAIKI